MAYTHLVAMGVDPHDANNMLDAAKPDSDAEALIEPSENPDEGKA